MKQNVLERRGSEEEKKTSKSERRRIKISSLRKREKLIKRKCKSCETDERDENKNQPTESER